MIESLLMDIDMTDKLNKLLIEVQQELDVPKNRYNKYGDFYYRSQEDILEAVKPLLEKRNLLLIITDEIKSVLNDIYIESSVSLRLDSLSESQCICVRAQAGISENKKMSLAQCYGTASSYSRKYSLNALFLLDDIQDDDAKEGNHKAEESQPTETAEKEWLNQDSEEWENVRRALINGSKNLGDALKKYKISKVNQEALKML